MSPYRLAWPRTLPFHGKDTGSNPVGDIYSVGSAEQSQDGATHRRVSFLIPKASTTYSSSFIRPALFNASSLFVSAHRVAPHAKQREYIINIGWQGVRHKYSSYQTTGKLYIKCLPNKVLRNRLLTVNFIPSVKHNFQLIYQSKCDSMELFL